MTVVSIEIVGRTELFTPHECEYDMIYYLGEYDQNEYGISLFYYLQIYFPRLW